MPQYVSLYSIVGCMVVVTQGKQAGACVDGSMLASQACAWSRRPRPLSLAEDDVGLRPPDASGPIGLRLGGGPHPPIRPSVHPSSSSGLLLLLPFFPPPPRLLFLRHGDVSSPSLSHSLPHLLQHQRRPPLLSGPAQYLQQSERRILASSSH